MTKKRKILIGVIAAIVLVAALVLFLIYSGIGTGIGSSEVAYVQKVSTLSDYGITVDRYSGVIEAQKAVTYKRTSGRNIETVYVKVGDIVAKDTPLFKYDVRQSENNITSINLEIESLNNEIAYLQAQGNSTEIQLQISERQLEIRQKQADLTRYQQEKDQSEVRSEIAGVVKAVNEKGEDANGNDDAIVTISEIGEFRVKGTVSEQTIGTISSGLPVIVRSRVDENETWTGTISKIETEPTTNQNENSYYYYDYGGGEKSSTYPFYVTLDSTKGLMLGQHVYIEPDYGQGEIIEKKGLWIDMAYVVMENEDAPYIWVSNNGRLGKRVVELGELDEFTYTVEIVSGLSADDYIAWPDDTLREGMKARDILEAE